MSVVINWSRNRQIFRNYKRLLCRKTKRHRKKAERWLWLACEYGIPKTGVRQIYALMRQKADVLLELPTPQQRDQEKGC